MPSNKSLLKIVYCALFLALAMVLPFITGQVPQFGKMLCPMHIPVLLCGFFVGPLYGALIGFIAPLVRFTIFGMPQIMPEGISMAFELMSYGMVAGLLYRKLPKTNLNVYISLIIAMIIGRLIWALAKITLMLMGKTTISIAIFVSAGFINAIPGIILQLVLIPLLVIKFRKFTL